jgi:replication factor A1
MGADGTSELEFVNFDQKYQLLIGKPLYGLEKKYDRFETPPEVQNLVGQNFTFIVRLSTKRSIENPLPSLEVIRTTQNNS